MTNRKLLRACMERYIEARGGAISEEEGAHVWCELEPLVKAATRYSKQVDRVIKSSKKRERTTYKVAKQSLRQTEQRLECLQKMQGGYQARNDPSRLGYSNGVRFEPAPSYSAWPTWHRPGKGKPNAS